MGDPISQLPTDTSANTTDEQRILMSLGKREEEAAPVPQIPASHEVRNLVIVTVLFVIFTRDFVDGFIARVIPSADTWYYKLLIRTVLFAALYFILTNINLSFAKQ
jgi:hypothetical protein